MHLSRPVAKDMSLKGALRRRAQAFELHEGLLVFFDHS
jgi:hypothetical protein